MPTISFVTSGGRASAAGRLPRAQRRQDRARGDQSDQLQRYIENGSFFSTPVPPEAQFFKHANRAYQEFAVRMGFFDQPQPVTFQLYQESLQKFRLSAEGVRAPVAP